MYELQHEEANVLIVTMTGKVTGNDYEKLVPKLESEIDMHGKLRILFDVSELDSIEPKAIWEDLKFDVKHREDYECLAVVGDERWHEWVTKMFKPFTTGEVRYFDEDEREQALAWIRPSGAPKKEYDAAGQ